MESAYNNLNENIKAINSALSSIQKSSKDDYPTTQGTSGKDSLSKEFFNLIELITDFFLIFETTTKQQQSSALLGLFLPIHAFCVSIFGENHLFSTTYEIKHVFHYFQKTFLQISESLIPYDFSPYVNKINTILKPFFRQFQIINPNINNFNNNIINNNNSSNSNNNNGNVLSGFLNEFHSKSLPHFQVTLSELSSPNPTAALSSAAVAELSKIKTAYILILDEIFIANKQQQQQFQQQQQQQYQQFQQFQQQQMQYQQYQSAQYQQQQQQQQFLFGGLSENGNSETIDYPPEHVNFFLELEYILNYFDKLLKIRDSVRSISKSAIFTPQSELMLQDLGFFNNSTFSTAKLLSNSGYIRVFAEKCLNFLSLEIRYLSERANNDTNSSSDPLNMTNSTNSAIRNFLHACTVVNEIVASTRIYNGSHILNMWETKLIPVLNTLSIVIDENYEIRYLNELFRLMKGSSIIDKIKNITANGVPTEFLQSYQFLTLLVDLQTTILKKSQQNNINHCNCNPMAVIPVIENLITITTARLTYSKLLFDRRTFPKIFSFLSEEPKDVEVLNYLNSCIQKLTNLGILQSKANNFKMRNFLALVDAIIMSCDMKWIKYLPSPDMFISLVSWYGSLKQQTDFYVNSVNAAELFVDHLFIDDLELSFLPSFFQFAERQFQLSQSIRPHLHHLTTVYELVPLINKIHEKYGSIDARIREREVDISAKIENLYSYLLKVYNNGIFEKEEKKQIADNMIPILAYLIYEDADIPPIEELINNICQNIFVPRFTDLLSDCYKSMECFDSWHALYPNELGQIFKDLLSLFNSVLDGTFAYFNDIKALEVSFREKIERIDQSLMNKFTVHFLKIEKYFVIGPMLQNITNPVLCQTTKEKFPLMPCDVVRIVAQVNHITLIKECIENVLNVEGALLDAQMCREFVENEISKNLLSNKMIDFCNSPIDRILDIFQSMNVVNPQFLLNYFNKIYLFLMQQIEASSFLYQSDATKVLEEAVHCLSEFAVSKDHFKLKMALNMLTNMTNTFLANENIHEIIMFKETINSYLDKANSLACLLQMKYYMYHGRITKEKVTPETQREETNNERQDTINENETGNINVKVESCDKENKAIDEDKDENIENKDENVKEEEDKSEAVTKEEISDKEEENNTKEEEKISDKEEKISDKEEKINDKEEESIVKEEENIAKEEENIEKQEENIEKQEESIEKQEENIVKDEENNIVKEEEQNIVKEEEQNIVKEEEQNIVKEEEQNIVKIEENIEKEEENNIKEVEENIVRNEEEIIVKEEEESNINQSKLNVKQHNDEDISLFEPFLTTLHKLNRRPSVLQMERKLGQLLSSSDSFESRFNFLRQTDPAKYREAKVSHLCAINDSLTKKLSDARRFNESEDNSHLRSIMNLPKLEESLKAVEFRNEERLKELEMISNQYENRLKERNEQFACLEDEASEEHHRTSIMQLIINNDLDLSKFDQQVVDPSVVFLYEQFKEATMANSRLTRELRNRSFRVDKPPLPPEAMIGIINESPRSRSWLSNEATNAMSLRGSLKLLQDQREELFRELVNETIAKPPRFEMKNNVIKITSPNTSNTSISSISSSSSLPKPSSLTTPTLTALASSSSSSNLPDTTTANGTTVETAIEKNKTTGKIVNSETTTAVISRANECLTELERIATSAETRKDIAAVQVEFASTADKVFFALEAEIEYLKEEIKQRKKYGSNMKEIQTKNLQKLIKVGIMPNNVQ